jgi:hypothetical protein
VAAPDSRNAVLFSALVALALAGAIGVAAGSYFSFRRSKPRLREVFVATRPLKAGDVLTVADLELRSVPEQYANGDVVDLETDLLGQRLVVEVARGDPVYRAFASSAAYVCKDPGKVQELCSQVGRTVPCKLSLEGFLKGEFGCVASYSFGSLNISVLSQDLKFTFEAHFPFGSDGEPRPIATWSAHELESYDVSIAGSGSRASPTFSLWHEDDQWRARAGKLTLTVDATEPRFKAAHGHASATLVPECVVDRKCPPDQQPFVHLEATF